MVLVVFLGVWRKRVCWLLMLLGHGGLIIFCSEDIECLEQQHNACTLVGDGLLELLVLLLTVFACALHLHLHHGNLVL